MERDDPASERLRVARRVRASRARVVALVPVGEGIDVAGAAAAIAGGLAVLGDEPIAVVDGWPSWRPAPPPAPPAGVPWARRRSGLVTTLTPAPERDGVAALALLAQAAAWARARFAHVLVDLTGLPAAHATTLEAIDALVPLAAAGRTREVELAAFGRALPSDRTLGVVLLG